LIALCAAAALIATWPLAPHADAALPLGDESAATVPLFNLWTLLWNERCARRGYADYWNAPIFCPATGTFAFSEPQPLTGLAFTLLRCAGIGVVLAYNLILLLALTLNGLAAARLVRSLGCRGALRPLAALLSVFLPFTIGESGVLQLVMVFPVLGALSAVVEISRPSRRGTLRLGLWCATTFLACATYALMLSVFLMVAWFAALVRVRNRMRTVRRYAGAFAVAAVLCMPVAWGQWRGTRGLSRSRESVQATSARLVDYLRARPSTVLQRFEPWLRHRGGSGHALYPGTALMLLALFGIVSGRRGRFAWLVRMCAGGACLAVVLSLGLNLRLGVIRPYEWFAGIYPGFHLLRNTFRFAMFAQIFLLILAAVGMHQVWTFGRRPERLAIGVLTAAALLESATPLRLYPFRQADIAPAWSQALASQPAGPFVLLPVAASGESRYFEPVALAMVQSLQEARPMINGYSGLFPPAYRETVSELRGFPDQRGVEYLRRSGVRYAVVESEFSQKHAREIAMHGLHLVAVCAKRSVFRIDP